MPTYSKGLDSQKVVSLVFELGDIPEVAKRLDVSTTTVKHHLKMAGVTCLYGTWEYASPQMICECFSRGDNNPGRVANVLKIHPKYVVDALISAYHELLTHPAPMIHEECQEKLKI